MNEFAISETSRRLANLIRPGVIQSVDAATARARVQIGALLTAPLPWLTQRAGDDRTWWAPSAGEQVLVLSPSGDLAAGWILPGAYTTAKPAPASVGTVHRTVYADGTVIEYDKSAHRLKADVKGDVELLADGNVTATVDGTVSVTAQGAVTVESAASATIKAPSVTIDSPTTTCTGQLTVQGLLTYQAGMAGSGGSGSAATITGNVSVSSGDVTADGKSLKTHVHSGVQSGGSNTGQPV